MQALRESTGEELKQIGLDLVESNAQTFVETMRSHAREIARKNVTVTSDDLREIADRDNFHPHHKNAWGAIFRGSEWMQIGYTKSRITSNHSRVIAVWALR